MPKGIEEIGAMTVLQQAFFALQYGVYVLPVRPLPQEVAVGPLLFRETSSVMSDEDGGESTTTTITYTLQNKERNVVATLVVVDWFCEKSANMGTRPLSIDVVGDESVIMASAVAAGYVFDGIKEAESLVSGMTC